MIPKRIFYIWFGKERPHWLEMTIFSWKEALPDFEIIEINEECTYFDFEYEYKNCEFFRTFYDEKMWALASDYARCKVLYDHGGIYMDTDMTIRKDFNPLLNNQFFIGSMGERIRLLSVGIMGSVKGYSFLKDVIDFYNKEYFNTPLYVVGDIFEKIRRNGRYDGFTIYNNDFFYPYKYQEPFTPECIKPCSYTVHWWAASWNKSITHEMMVDKKYWQSKNKKLYLIKKKILNTFGCKPKT